MKKIVGIYAIKNQANGKVYIGQSVDIARRWRDHLNELKQNKHRNSHLQSAFLMYGVEAFTFEIIEECSREMLDELEHFYIREFNSLKNGYNQESGGNLNKKISAETKVKMSKAKSGKNNPKATAVLCVERNEIFNTQDEAARELGLDQSSISKVCNGLRNACGGYHWRYVERS